MPNYPAMTKQKTATTDDVLQAFAEFRPRLDTLHMPDFLGLDITMAQAKIVLLLVASKEVRMSELVRRLGTSLSTVSGHVERLVEQGLITRRDDPADRRQVLVAPTAAALDLAERFDQINSRQLRLLMDGMTAEERGDVARAFDHLGRAIERHLAAISAQPDERTAQ
jgi:DNA-binding MarR family transcriptional regulator